MKITYGMPDAEYRALDGVNASRLGLAFKSVKHYKENLGISETDAMKLGSALHCAMLEPDLFKKSYVIEPTEVYAYERIPKGKTSVKGPNKVLQPTNKKMPEHREIIREWKTEQESNGSIVLDPTQLDSLTGMIASLKDEMQRTPTNEKAMPLSEIFNEHTKFEVVGQGEIFGVKAKGKADIITQTRFGRTGIDLKKTVSASADDFTRKIWNLHYDLQAAWYKELFELDAYFWLCVEEKAPHPIGFYDAVHYLDHGKKKAVDLLEKVKTDESFWYTNGLEPLTPLTWQQSIMSNEF